MQSPRDPNATLVRTELLPGLIAHRCPTSGGIWIDTIAYWDWVKAQPGFPEPSVSFESPVPASIDDDSDQPLISPRSGRLMRKCKAGSGLGFRIDFDPSSGFWLDRDEYETLRSHSLHDELHLICSPAYQRELVRMQTTRAEQQRFEQRLGAEACERISAFADWITRSPNHAAAMTYLMNRIEHTQRDQD